MIPELIIFDCDGVLIDSEPIAVRILVETLADQGIVVSDEDAYRRYLGRSLETISASLLDSHGRALGEAALGSMRTNLFAAFREELRASPGIPDIFARLRSPFCCASSSHTERIRVGLASAGLLPWFEGRMFSASDVPNGKPEPDLFLHAATELGVPPQRCLVVEDSPAGIEAARRAGMTVFAYVGGSHVVPGGLLPAIRALGPDAIFDDMHALPDLVRSPRTEKRAVEG